MSFALFLYDKASYISDLWVFPSFPICIYYTMAIHYTIYGIDHDLICVFFCLSQFQLVGFFGTNYIKLQENPIEIMGKSSVVDLYII